MSIIAEQTPEAYTIAVDDQTYILIIYLLGIDSWMGLMFTNTKPKKFLFETETKNSIRAVQDEAYHKLLSILILGGIPS